jgi:hypothetical protein
MCSIIEQTADNRLRAIIRNGVAFATGAAAPRHAANALPQIVGAVKFDSRPSQHKRNVHRIRPFNEEITK